MLQLIVYDLGDSPLLEACIWGETSIIVSCVEMNKKIPEG